MSLLRRRTVLRRFFAALERIASNVGLIREAGKEFRLFSAEEVTLVRQLAESRQRLQDLRAQRDEESRLVHSILARQVKEAVTNVEAQQTALLAQHDALLGLCRQLLRERHLLTAALAQLPSMADGSGGGGGGGSGGSAFTGSGGGGSISGGSKGSFRFAEVSDGGAAAAKPPAAQPDAGKAPAQPAAAPPNSHPLQP